MYWPEYEENIIPFYIWIPSTTNLHPIYFTLIGFAEDTQTPLTHNVTGKQT